MKLDPLDEILNDFMIGNISQEQLGQLQQVLQSDHSARARFVRDVLTETRLQSLGRSGTLLPPAESPSSGSGGPAAAEGAGKLLRFIFLGAAIAAAGAGTLLFLSSKDVAKRPPIAAPGEDVQSVEGWIQSVDPSSATFVLSTGEGRQMTFRLPSSPGEQEGQCFLDGELSTFAAAVQAGRHARVSRIEMRDHRWATQVEVASEGEPE